MKSETLNSPSTFAQSAKMVRQARAKEAQLKALKQRASVNERRLGLVVLAFRAVLYLLVLAAMWGRAAVTLPRGVSVWPISSLLALPDCWGGGWAEAGAGGGEEGEHGHGDGGGGGHGHGHAPLQVISATVWLFLCDRAFARLLRSVPPDFLALRPAPGSGKEKAA